MLGSAGLSQAKRDAANAAAVAACDGADGVVDQVIAEPRRCHFDAFRVDGLSPAEAKAIYHGTNDPLIVPFGSYNYQQRLFDRYGVKVKGTRSFVRTFFFPGVSHTDPTLAGTGSAQDQMLDALQAWAERGDAPGSFVQADSEGQGRLICAYPDTPLTAGDDHSCRPRS
ncbi:tannase/feruloyl esterase family alpha/beta hydrolase [Sphaerisporangium perillae]|uniref:tannase/feruloyl esterase family alpha/beta hydrolase n=1 Tax=Sphaerisporangium perillae TaxID=2935860 RepID=UPI00200D744E|nr:tannase/feruloyl esterase family alpha/beta hydrolase [Sphaerisporangium perillae]